MDETGRLVPFWLSGGGEVSTNVEFLFHATLLVTDSKNHAVHAFDAHHGHFVKTLVAPKSGGLLHPQGIAYGADGNVFVASSGTDQILRYQGGSGQYIGVFVQLQKGCHPKGIEFGPDGNLFVACFHLGKVIAYNAQSGQQLGVAATGGGLSRPTGLAFGPGSTLYVVSSGSNQLLSFAQGGYFQGAVERNVEHGTGVTYAGGSIFMSGGPSRHNAVLKIEGGHSTHFAESFELHKPVGLLFDQAGFLHVASGESIVRFTDRGQFVSSAKANEYQMEAGFLALSPRERLAQRGHHEL